jgi:hypothetical protein
LKISSFRVVNYRSLKELAMENLGNLNVIVGRNSAGKSNILEAMNLFFSEFEPVKGATIGLDDYVWTKGSAGPIVFDVSLDFIGEGLTGLSGEDQAFLNSILGSSPTTTLKITRSLIDAHGAWRTDSIEWGTINLVKDDVPQLSPELKIDAPTLDRILRILPVIVKNRFRLIGAGRDPRGGDRFRAASLDESVQSRLWTLQQSTSSRDEENYTAFESAFTEMTSFRLDPAQARLMVKKENRRFPLTLEGGGVQGTTNLLYAVLLETDGSTITGIEDPENNCHPGLLRRLSIELERVSQRRQIFISTHSPVIVDSVTKGAVWVITFTDGETMATRAARADDVEGLLREMGIRPSDVLFSDRVILVERKSEKVVLEAFAQKLGIDLSDAAIVPVKRKGDPTRTLEAVVSMFEKVVPTFVILDSDDGAEAAQLVEKKVVPREMVHVWKAGSIDAYYPMDCLKEALQEISSRYSLNLNVSRLVQDVQSGKVRANKIDIGDKLRLLDSTWEMTLAKEFVKALSRSHPEISTEVRDTLIAAAPDSP